MRLSTALLLCFITSLYATNFKIVIDFIKGVDNDMCLNGKTPCKSLDHVLTNASLTDTQVVLISHNFITKNYTLINVTNLSIRADSSLKTISCPIDNSGIHFIFSENVILENVQIKFCGAQLQFPSEFRDDLHPIVNVALSFIYCKQVTIANSSFHRNKGVAISLVNVRGVITIKKNNFLSNYDDNGDCSKGKCPAGGGLFIKFSKCNALKPFHCDDSLVDSYNFGALYDINDNEFINNTAVSEYDGITESLPLNGGAGISLHILGKSENNLFKIENCHFERNTANFGGAIFFTFKDSAQNNTILFQNLTFLSNKAHYAGGAVRMRFSIIDSRRDVKLLSNAISFLDSSFSNNTAIWGGAVSVAGGTRSIYAADEASRNLYFIRCSFVFNSATVGFAMGFAMENLNSDVIGLAPSYQVVLNTCLFHGNFMALTEDQSVIGQGAVYVDEIDLLLLNKNVFTENNYTAITLDSSLLKFAKNSTTIFDSNSGLEGGAVALYGSSFLVVSTFAYVLFQNNLAYTKGGAIFYKYGGPPRLAFNTTKLQSAKCFLQCSDCGTSVYNEWKMQMKFINNTAPDSSGSSVYATTLQFCRNTFDGRHQSSAFDWSFVSFENNLLNNRSEVVTNAVSIHIIEHEWHVQPDIPFSPSVTMLDEKNQSVYGSIKVQFTTPNFVLEPPNNLFLMKDKISRLRVDGQTNKDYSFYLLTTAGQMVRTPDYYVKTTLCQLGYKVNENKTKCICMDSIKGTVVRCNEGNISIAKGHWGYKDKNNELDIVICPLRYCQCENDVKENYLCRFNENNQCTKNRRGVLCSQCKEGLSVKFGNEECAECSDTYLLLLIPVLFGTFFLVYLIFLTNIDAFSGYLNCFLYCYQIITLLLPENVELDEFISFVIGISSLQGTGGNLGFCFYNGMTNLQKLPLNYILPTMVIMWSFIIGKAPQKTWNKFLCRIAAKNEREEFDQRYSFGRALSFVLVICYTAFTVPTLKLLRWVDIDGKRVVFDAANIGFFEGEHLWYGLLAVFILICIVIGFPVMLLFTSFFLKYPTIARYRPVIEALRSCYRETSWSQRCIVYYFLCRLMIQSVAVIINVEFNRLIFLTVLCILIQVVFAVAQPYKYSSYNLWDLLLLTDMCFVSLLSMVLSVPFTTTELIRDSCRYSLNVLVYVPLITVVLRFFIWCYSKRIRPKDHVDGGQENQQTGESFRRMLDRFRNNNRRMNLPTRAVERLPYENFEAEYLKVDT